MTWQKYKTVIIILVKKFFFRKKPSYFVHVITYLHKNMYLSYMDQILLKMVFLMCKITFHLHARFFFVACKDFDVPNENEWTRIEQ